MDPVQAMFGNAIGQIGGAAISAYGQSQANAANLAFAQQQASGAYLGQYVAAEKAAGINPYSAGSGPTASFQAVNPLGEFARLQGITPSAAVDPMDKELKAEELRSRRLQNTGQELALEKLRMRGASSPEGTVRQAVNQVFGSEKDPPFPYNLVGPGMSAVLGGVDTGASFLQRHLPQSVVDWMASHNMD